jgi:sugar phosphate isomerase/epimerase
MNGKEILIGGTARSPEQVMELHGLGLDFAEVPITDPDKFEEVKEGFSRLKDRLGILYLCHGPSEGDPNDMETLENVYLPKLMGVLSIMPKLDMEILTMHLWMDSRFLARKTLAYKIGLLKRIIQRAGDSGITVCIENLSENADHLAPAFEQVPGLCMTLDLGHAQLLTKQNTSHEFMDRYPERIRHIHLHDNRGGDSPLHDLHLPVGEGIIDFEHILSHLREIEYAGTVTLELKPHEIARCLERVKRLLLP